MEARGYSLASYLGEGEAEGRAAGWGAAVTQPPGQAARSGFPSPAFPRRWPLPAPHRGVTVPAPARYVSLRALCLPLTGPLCSPVCLTRSAVCGSRCLSQCTCISAHLVSFRACVGRVPVIMPAYMTLRGCLCLCVCLAPVSVFCLGLPLHHLRDHVCLCTCPSGFAFMFLNRVWETLEQADPVDSSPHCPES